MKNSPTPEWATKARLLLIKIQASGSLVNPQLSADVGALIREANPSFSKENVVEEAAKTYASMVGAAKLRLESAEGSKHAESSYKRGLKAARQFIRQKLKDVVTKNEIEILIDSLS